MAKRKLERASMRPLSMGDLKVLDFLWMWKAASLQMLGLVGYPKKSAWWVYKAIRQLEKEKMIERLPRNKHVFQEVFALTELGFQTVVLERDDLAEHRFRIHAPAHDYLATCLQLGDLWLSRAEKTFYSEQMLSSLQGENFPKGIKGQHIPDGFTILGSGEKAVHIGYEVDLNLKPSSRYVHTVYYHWFQARVDFLVWLVRDDRLYEQIQNVIGEQAKKDHARISYIRLDDFKRLVCIIRFNPAT